MSATATVGAAAPSGAAKPPRAVRPPTSWPLGPRERPGVKRTAGSRLLDLGHRAVVSALILGTGYLMYQMAAGVYQSAARHITAHTQHGIALSLLPQAAHLHRCPAAVTDCPTDC